MLKTALTIESETRVPDSMSDFVQAVLLVLVELDGGGSLSVGASSAAGSRSVFNVLFCEVLFISAVRNPCQSFE